MEELKVRLLKKQKEVLIWVCEGWISDLSVIQGVNEMLVSVDG